MSLSQSLRSLGGRGGHRTVQLLTGQRLEREDRKYLWEKKLLPQELNPYLVLVKCEASALTTEPP